MGRIPNGIEGEDRIALGLSASRLGYLLGGALSAYVIYLRPWPWAVRIALLVVLSAATTAMAFLRLHGQPLENWIAAAIEYYSTPRRAAPAPSPVSDAPPPTEEASPHADSADKILDLPVARPGIAERHQRYAEDPSPSPPYPAESQSVPVFLPGTQRIIFFSIKGGVGRTTLATEVACTLARYGYYRDSATASPRCLRVVLADLDLASANVSMRLGLTQPTLVDFLAQATDPTGKPLDPLLTHPGSNLRVILGPPKSIAANGAIGAAEVRRILERLEQEAPHFLIIDVGSEITDVTVDLMRSATTIFYVMAPTAGAVQDTYRGMEALRRLGLGSKVRYVVNKARGRWDFSEPMSDLQGTMCGEIPFDERFEEAENRHQPLVLQSPCAARTALFELAAQIYPGIAGHARRPRRGWLWAPLARLVQRHAG